MHYLVAYLFLAAGWYGVYITDFSVIVTLFGVCISYQITFAALLSELPYTFMPSKAVITLISGLLLLPLCRVKSLRNLSFMSLDALVCLAVAALTILIYGVSLYGTEAFQDKSDRHVLLWSDNSSDIMFLLGVSTYCFGLCAAVIPIEENMQSKVFYTIKTYH
jgi:amino acid permease